MILSNVNAYNFKGDASSLKFTDVNDRYTNAVAGLMANGITEGTSATKFGTGNSIKRGDFAIFAYRAETLTFGGDVYKDFREAMNGFSSVGAALGFKVVVDETAVNTFNIIGTGDAVDGDGATGFFDELAGLGIKIIEVNGAVYEISDGEGNLTADTEPAKQAIIASLIGDQTVDLTFLVPYDEAYSEASYTFNLIMK